MARTQTDRERTHRSDGRSQHDVPGGWGSALAIVAVVLFLLLAWVAMRDGAADEVAQLDPPRSVGEADPGATAEGGTGGADADALTEDDGTGAALGQRADEEEGTEAPVDGEAGVAPEERGDG